MDFLIRKIAAFLAAFTLALTSTGCGGPTLRRFDAEFLTLFDTVTKVIGRAESEEAFREFAQFVHDELEVYHRLYDIYHDYEGISNLKTVNDSAGKAPVAVDRKIIDLLLLAREMYETTGGKMNPALGPVLKLWHDARQTAVDDPESAALPPDKALRNAAAHTDFGLVEIDEAVGTVFLPHEAMRLDVGSVGKGYAVQRVYQSALEAGYRDFAISVGGNVIAHGSRDEKGTPWNISLQNPDPEDGEPLFNINLSGMALVTSGNYQRYFIYEGKRYHHIIDPDTLYPADYYAAVSVLSPDSGEADCLSTALYCLPEDKARELLKSFPGTMAVFVYSDGRITYAGGFENYIRKSE